MQRPAEAKPARVRTLPLEKHTHSNTMQETHKCRVETQPGETEEPLSLPLGKVQFDNRSHWFSCLQAFYRIQHHHYDL